MTRFSTYHWQGFTFHAPEFEAPRVELESPSSEAAAVRAFTTLLRSENMSAKGIALDHYHYAISMERHGLGAALKDYSTEVLKCARSILGAASVVGGGVAEETSGAAIASALLVMINKAEQEDAELIKRVLDSPPSFDAESAAFRSAGRIIQLSSEPNMGLIGSLCRVVFDESRYVDERLEALQALSKSGSPHAVAEVRRAADLNDLELQATAILALCREDLAGHQDFIGEKVASWPDDAPYPASDVRDVLSDLDAQEDPQ